MAKDFSGGPKPLKPTFDKPENTNFSAPAVPVVQPNKFGSSQSGDTFSAKFTPVASKTPKK